MTRINAGIPPSELSDLHLRAEHREIKRIPNTIKSGKAKVTGIPETFRLGTGHVKFFYDKLKYLHDRYNSLLNECRQRGFNMTDFNDAWDNVPPELYNDWEPTDEARSIVRQRIKERS